MITPMPRLRLLILRYAFVTPPHTLRLKILPAMDIAGYITDDIEATMPRLTVAGHTLRHTRRLADSYAAGATLPAPLPLSMLLRQPYAMRYIDTMLHTPYDDDITLKARLYLSILFRHIYTYAIDISRDTMITPLRHEEGRLIRRHIRPRRYA